MSLSKLFKTDRSQQTQIVSWNANGLCQHQKWRKVHNLFKNRFEWDVTCMQETKLDEYKLSKLRVPLMQGRRLGPRGAL